MRKDVLKNKLNQFRKYAPLAVKRGLISFNLLKGNDARSKFVIIGAPRTGSNLLMSLLNSHPNCICYGEIFTNLKVGSWDIPFSLRKIGDINLKENNPVGYLESRIYSGYPEEIKSAGFKLFYHHARKENEKTVWDYLKGESSIKKIHLLRDNYLEIYLSHISAKKNGQFVDTWDRSKTIERIKLDVIDCENYFKNLEENIESTREFFSPEGLIEIKYEELVNHRQSVLDVLLSKLNLDRLKLSPKTYRQNYVPVEKRLENYNEMKEYFSDSKWSKFFIV